MSWDKLVINGCILAIGIYVTYEGYQEPQPGETWNETTNHRQEYIKLAGYGIISFAVVALILH